MLSGLDASSSAKTPSIRRWFSSAAAADFVAYRVTSRFSIASSRPKLTSFGRPHHKTLGRERNHRAGLQVPEACTPARDRPDRDHPPRASDSARVRSDRGCAATAPPRRPSTHRSPVARATSLRLAPPTVHFERQACPRTWRGGLGLRRGQYGEPGSRLYADHPGCAVPSPPAVRPTHPITPAAVDPGRPTPDGPLWEPRPGRT